MMTWDCSLCGERFENQEELSRHLRTRHKNKVKLIKLEHPLRPKGRVKSRQSLTEQTESQAYLEFIGHLLFLRLFESLKSVMNVHSSRYPGLAT